MHFDLGLANAIPDRIIPAPAGNTLQRAGTHAD